MRDFDQVLAFSAERREIRVQTGITWREILEYVDRYDLSPQIMQSSPTSRSAARCRSTCMAATSAKAL